MENIQTGFWCFIYSFRCITSLRKNLFVLQIGKFLAGILDQKKFILAIFKAYISASGFLFFHLFLSII